MSSLERVPSATHRDADEIRRRGNALAADVTRLLSAETTQARQILRALLHDKIELAPVGRGKQRGYRFSGALTIGRALDGAAITDNTSGVGGPNGIRTRVLALRGPCPRPLDDGAGHTRNWLGEEDSNPRYQGQNLVSYP